MQSSINNIYQLEEESCRKSDPIWTSAHPCHVCVKPDTDHADRSLSPACSYPGTDRNPAPECHVCGRNRYADPALPHMEDRFQTSGCNGSQFYAVTVLSTVAANYGYPAVIGAVMIGGIMEGTLGLLAKYWRKIITPVVAASVVTSIGFSLFTVGARSLAAGTMKISALRRTCFLVLSHLLCVFSGMYSAKDI